MNKKAQIELGPILMVFILVIIGLVLLTTTAQLIGDVINTQGIVNESLESENGTTLANIVQLQGKFVTDVVVFNGTNDLIIESGNYTIFQNQVRDGVETAGINVSTHAAFQILDWKISYTFQPTTYISNGGGRVIAGLIIIFFAIAIAIITLFPILKNKFFDVLGK